MIDKINEDLVIRYVEKICISPEFCSKAVLRRFLSYIVSETMAGRGNKIKAYSIGVDVFNRGEDFDPGQDTLVRINAIRLRRMLDLYYSHSGKNDDIQINIPKGGYIPQFISRLNPKEKLKEAYVYAEKQKLCIEPSIAVLSFNDLEGDSRNRYFTRGFSYELLVALCKYEDLQVYNYLAVTELPAEGSILHSSMIDKGIRFVLGGAIHGDEQRINVLVHLHDLNNKKLIWSEKYSKQIVTESLFEIQENIVRSISAKIGDDYGIIPQRLTQDIKILKPQNLNTYSAILKYYYYLGSRSPESARDAFSSLTTAVENDPTSGIALACLASMHATFYGMDFPNSDKSYELVGELAEKAYTIDPYNLIVQNALAYKHFNYNEKRQFFNLSYQILKKNPKGTIRLGHLGFHLSLYGDWILGKSILDEVMYAYFDYPSYFHGATTCYYYRLDEYAKALEEANKYKVPQFFWGPLLRIAVLGQMNRPCDSKQDILELKQLRPDFEDRAQILIRRFVKEESLVLKIMEGLNKAGLKI